MSQEIQQPLEESSPLPFEKLLETYDIEIDQAYSESLVRSTENDAVKFGLEDIPEDVKSRRTKQLHEKLKEYTLRIREESNKLPYLHIAEVVVSSRYKRDILRLILKDNSVNTWALARAYENLDGEIDVKKFYNACGVMEKYIKTGGRGVVGGTGLPQIASK